MTKYLITIAVDAEDEESRMRKIVVEAETSKQATDMAYSKMGDEEGIVDIEEITIAKTPEDRVLGKLGR